MLSYVSKLTNEAAKTNKLDIAIELTEWFNNDFNKFDYMFETVAGGIESVLEFNCSKQSKTTR